MFLLHTVVLEDAAFHSSVSLAQWPTQRILSFRPPQGEFCLLQYRVNQVNSGPPFVILPTVSIHSSTRIELTLTLRNTLPDTTCAINVSLSTTLPVGVSLASHLPLAVGQTIDSEAASRELHWRIGRLKGGHSTVANIKLSVERSPESAMRQVGPFSLNFEVPMHTLSGVAVRHLRLAQQENNSTAQRWVRYVTQAGSYTCRAS